MFRQMILAVAIALSVAGGQATFAAGPPVIDITAFGATANDGTDDTLAIQKAIDIAEAEAPATVVFPRGSYHFTTMTIDKPNVTLEGHDCRLEQVLGTGYNQALYIKGTVDGGTAANIKVRGLTIDCNYPAVNSLGSGIGINCRADSVTLEDVTVEATEDTTFVSSNCLYTTYDRCVSRNAGRHGFRPRGDLQRLLHCKVFDWNAINANNQRALIADGQEIDAYELFVDDFYAHFSVPRDTSDGILIDCGDGDAQGSNTLSAGNSGQATQVNGKAAWTIDAGHGFAPGDGIRIQNSFVASYDGSLTSGTAQAGSTASTIVLSTGASSTNNTYNGYEVYITGGTGSGQSRTVSTYAGASRTATMTANWTVTPDATSTYYVTQSGKLHKVNSVTGEVYVYVVDANTLKLYTTASAARLNAGSATGRYDLTDGGTGTFYIKSYGGIRKAFTVASTVDDTITCTGHGFQTGRIARLTVDTEATDSLPTGLKNVALITTNTDYAGAGSSAKYWRRKKIQNVTLRNVTLAKISPQGNNQDSMGIKVNNTENLLIDRFIADQTPWDSAQDSDDETLRIGPGNRKVTVMNSILPNGFICNTYSWIPELEIAHCEIGTQAYYPQTALQTMAVAKLYLHHNKIRFSYAALETPNLIDDFRDDDCDGWEIHDNLFEGHSTADTRTFLINNLEHLRRSGLVRFWNNDRCNAGTPTAPYAGKTLTASTTDTITVTAHCLSTGDEVYTATTNTLPTGLATNTKYFVRRTGDNTLTLHTSRDGATDDTNRVDITSAAGVGTHTLHGRKVGCVLTFSNPRDRGWLQVGSSGREFVGVTAPSNSSWAFQAGDVMWQMNPIPGGSPGWRCTKTGVAGTTAATFEPIPAGSRSFSIVTYGARPDDALDDTTAIQAAVDAAEAWTAANVGSDAEVTVPAGVFLVGSGISAGSGAVEIGANAVSNYVTMRGEGCLKLFAGSSADAVVELVGNHCRLEGIRVDGNASGSPAGRGEGVRVNGSYCHVVDVIAQNTKTTGSTGTTFEIFGSPCVGNVIERCTSINAGYHAFENRGDYTTFRDIVLLEFLGHGFAQAGGNKNELTIDGFYASSSVSTLDCLVVDPSYTTDSTKDGYKLERFRWSNATCLAGASMSAGAKVARCSDASLDNVSVIHSTTGYSSFKIAEAVGKLSIRNSFFSRDINQDGSPTDADGTLTGATTDNGGYAKFACTGHDVKSGDYIVMTGTTNYDGIQLVTDSETNAFTTNKKYVSGESSGTWYSAAGEILLGNVTCGDRVHTGFSGSVNGLRADRVSLNRCNLRNYQNMAVSLDNAVAAGSIFTEISLTDCYLESLDSSGTCVVLAYDSGSGVVVPNTDVVKMSGLQIQDKGSVTTTGVAGTNDRQEIVTANKTLTGLDSGKTFIVADQSLVMTLPAVSGLSGVGSGCVYRFVLRSDGLTAGTGLSLSPASVDKIMGNGFTAADNKDAILGGAADREGDSITIVSDGQDGWIITNVIGTWTREP